MQRRTNPSSGRGPDGVGSYPNQHLTTIFRGLSTIMPDRFVTRLTYNGQKLLTITSGNVFTAYRWYPSALFDVDPLLGSTTVVGFSELSNFYYYYRVLASRFTCAVASNYIAQGTGALAATSTSFVVVPLNADPGSSPSQATVDSWFNNPYNKHRLIGAPGSRPEKFVSKMSTEKIFGSKMVYTDDNFASLVSTIPNNNWYWACAVRSTTAAPASGYTYSFQTDMEFDCEFYSRKPLLN
jgi:hypothetical protein